MTRSGGGERAVAEGPGTIVVLNGAPRSGKSSIAAALQASASSSDALWFSFGVDAMAGVIPAALRPGIGLRPGGERPDLEGAVVELYDVLFTAVVAWSRAGVTVVVDVGLHDDYATPLGIPRRVAGVLTGLPAYFVGVRCPVEVIMARRDADPGGAFGGPGASGGYVTSEPDGSVPDAVVRWERAVHDPGLYDLEVDTATLSPVECAAAIVRRVAAGPPIAFASLA